MVCVTPPSTWVSKHRQSQVGGAGGCAVVWHWDLGSGSAPAGCRPLPPGQFRGERAGKGPTGWPSCRHCYTLGTYLLLLGQSMQPFQRDGWGRGPPPPCHFPAPRVVGKSLPHSEPLSPLRCKGHTRPGSRTPAEGLAPAGSPWGLEGAGAEADLCLALQVGVGTRCGQRVGRSRWARSRFSCSPEESHQEGPQALGPLPPVGAREGAGLPAPALHAALRVRLLPGQEVRPGRGWGGGQCPGQDGRLAPPGAEPGGSLHAAGCGWLSDPEGSRGQARRP